MAVGGALALAATAGLASAERPEPGHTGGFGEPTCRACHVDQPADDPEGALAIEGLPAIARGGETYRLRVVLTRSGLRRGGFELAVRFAGGERAGRSAGLLRPVDGRVEVTPSGQSGVAYAHHGPLGTAAAAPGSISWEIDWTAPAESARLLLHAAANATNDDDSELGDFVYAVAAEAASETRGDAP